MSLDYKYHLTLGRQIPFNHRLTLDYKYRLTLGYKYHLTLGRQIPFNFSYLLRNIEDGLLLVYTTNNGSPWFKRLTEAEEWLREREKLRLEVDNIERPSTKWVFAGYSSVDVKVVLDRQPLLVAGPLPDWLRNLAHGRSMVALDTFRDSLCLWHCIAVHRGERLDRCTRTARALAMVFLRLGAAPNDIPRTSVAELDEVEDSFLGLARYPGV